MSWLATAEGHRYSWYVRPYFALKRRLGQTIAEPVRLWARTPRVFVAFLRLYRALDRKTSPVAPALRSLIMVKISQLNVCPFCVHLNATHALERGCSEEKLLELHAFEESPLFSEPEKAALAFAETMTLTGRRIEPALAARLREHYSDDAIIELAALIAFQNMSSKFNAGLDVPAQGFCRIPIPSN
jgi:AhpD family alkylhydroperoxidase